MSLKEADTGAGFGLKGTSTTAAGVIGESSGVKASGKLMVAGPNSGVHGAHTKVGRGVSGYSAQGNGVVGMTSQEHRAPATSGLAGDFSLWGWGVVGYGRDGVGGTYGSARYGHGVLGITESSGSAGVQGANRGGGAGVRGVGAPDKDGIGVKGEGKIGVSGESKTPGGAGVKGRAVGTRRPDDEIVFGVLGVSDRVGVAGASLTGTGVAGYAEQGYAVVGLADDKGGIGVIGSGGGRAGLFLGDVDITGTLWKAVDLFHIDHPTDPANKYLNHAAVESSEMKNVYDGVAVLNRSGRVRVRLPRWFEALNTSFRYQLTSIGGPAPELHVAREVRKGEFWIAGGKPQSKVSWQVTGVRKDPWAKAHPLVVEQRKTGPERGRYRHAEAYGKPASRGVGWLHREAAAPAGKREAVLRQAFDYRSESTARRGRKRTIHRAPS